MMFPGFHTLKRRTGLTVMGRVMLAGATVLAVGGCREDRYAPQVAGWTLIDHTQRHPILVSQEPAQIAIRVPDGAAGLSPGQRAEIVDFVGSYRAHGAGSSRLVVGVPIGGPNETAATYAADEIRDLLGASGFPEHSIMIEPYQVTHDGVPPIRISYLRFSAEGPQCGNWPTNLAYEPNNLPYHDFGCPTQHNLAAQIANPGDLVAPRAMSRRASERRDVVNDRYGKGEVTGARRGPDENVDIQAKN